MRVFALAGLLAACSNDPATVTSANTISPAFSKSGTSIGTVYLMSNADTGNAVLAYARAADGSLTEMGSFPTGGNGTSSGLGNQGGLVLDQSGSTLLVVNAGSDNLTSFRVGNGGDLSLVSTVASGGLRPISVTVSHGVVYVLNAGGTGNITGFRLSPHGALTMIPGSTRPLSSDASGPAQVGFDPTGRWLVVAEKATDVLSSYAVDRDGLATGPVVTPSVGATPFGFEFTHQGTLVVSEAFGGAADASAVSSYRIGAGSLGNISASVPTTETAACWIAITGNGRFAYTTNAGSGSISGYAIAGGRLTLLDADGITADLGPGTTPLDMAFSRDSKYLYTLEAGTHEISVLRAGADGSLAPVAGGVTGLPESANGMAVR